MEGDLKKEGDMQSLGDHFVDVNKMIDRGEQ